MFIEGKKYLKLKEAAQNGDERAKEILTKQYKNDNSNLENLISDFFNPVSNEEVLDTPVKGHFKPITRDEKLKKFMKDNGIKESDPDYEEALEDFNSEIGNTIEEIEEMPNEEADESLSDIAIEKKPEVEDEIIGAIKGLIADELEALRGYNNAINLILVSSDDQEAKQVLESIATEEKKHIEMLRRLLK